MEELSNIYNDVILVKTDKFYLWEKVLFLWHSLPIDEDTKQVQFLNITHTTFLRYWGWF